MKVWNAEHQTTMKKVEEVRLSIDQSNLGFVHQPFERPGKLSRKAAKRYAEPALVTNQCSHISLISVSEALHHPLSPHIKPVPRTLYPLLIIVA